MSVPRKKIGAIFFLLIMLLVFQPAIFSQKDMSSGLKGKEELEMGIKLAPSKEELGEEEIKGFKIAPIRTVNLETPCYRVVSSSSDYSAFSTQGGKLVIYNLKEKEMLLEKWFLQGAIYALAFHPERKNVILLGNKEGEIVIFDIEKGERLKAINLAASISDIKFSADAVIIAVSDLGGNLTFYDGETFEETSKIKEIAQAIYSISFNPESSHLAMGSRDKTVKIFSLGRMEVSQAFEAHRFLVLSVEFSPLGGYLVSGGADGQMIVWKKRGDTFEDEPYFVWRHKDWVTSVKFSKDYLLTGCKDGKIRIFDILSKKLVGIFEVGESAILSIDIHPQSPHLLVGSTDSFKVYDFDEILRKISP